MPDNNEPDVRSSVVQVRIGSRVYDTKYNRQCFTCTHPARMQIEQMLIQGHPYADIADLYSETTYEEGNAEKVFPKITWQNIQSHYKNGHCPLTTRTIREIVDERSRAIADSYSGMAANYIDPVLTAQAIMAKGFEAMMDGDHTPSIAETLNAAKLLREFEKDSDTSANEEAWSQAMQIYFQEAQQVMPPDQWQKFTQNLTSNPILKAMAARMNEEDDVLDAEVVEHKEITDGHH